MRRGRSDQSNRLLVLVAAVGFCELGTMQENLLLLVTNRLMQHKENGCANRNL